MNEFGFSRQLRVCLGILSLLAAGCGSDDEGSGPADAAVDAAQDLRPGDTGRGAQADAAPVICPGDGGFALRPDAGVSADARPKADVAPGAPQCDPDPIEMLPTTDGQVRHCAFDIGSKNIKLLVTTMTPGDPLTLDDLRDCKAVRGLGDKTFDQKTMTPQPLPKGDLDDLAALVNDYVAICKNDKATIVGAVATEWARRATNPDEIKATFKAKTGLDLDILPTEREGAYGYTAAARGKLNQIILDSGSRSFQLSYWYEKDAEAKSISIPLGTEEAGDKYFGKPEYGTYAAARAAFVAALREATKGKLDEIKAYLADKKLDKTLSSLGDSSLMLAVQDKVRDPCNGRWVDPDRFDEINDERKRNEPLPRMRVLTTSEISSFLDKLGTNQPWYDDLRSDRVRKGYGNKMMAGLALLSFLLDELKLDTVRFTSGEMAEGVIIERAGK